MSGRGNGGRKPEAKQVICPHAPFAGRPLYDPAVPWEAIPGWPAHWVHPVADWRPPWVAIFRCRFTLDRPLRDWLHVTASDRYELYLNGKWVGRGSERGDRAHWHYETYALALSAGAHVLVARVWALGGLAPWAQAEAAPGILCCPENPALIPKLATGPAKWQVRRCDGYSFTSGRAQTGADMGGGPYESVQFQDEPPDWQHGTGSKWQSVRPGASGNSGFHLYASKPIPWLRPATLPAQERGIWSRFSVVKLQSARTAKEWRRFLLGGEGFSIPPRTRETIWIDLEDYVCGYLSLRWSGGAESRITTAWAEALRAADGKKQRLPDGEGLRLDAPKDEILADGKKGRWWRSLWWRCGRFLEITVETGSAPLKLENFTLEETRYPLEAESSWGFADDRLKTLLKVCVRTAQMCAHETYVDCPYYEQLMYVGDTRVQCLLTYVLTHDDRLARKAVEFFDASRLNPSGWTTSAYPASAGQIIPPFSLWWIAMAHDYARWRGGREFISQRLPGIRSILEQCHAFTHEDGMVAPPGWNFVDSAYPGGVPPGAHPGGQNAALQLQYILALGHAAELETQAGEPELAALHLRRQRAAVGSLMKRFWVEERGLFTDDPARQNFSEHVQCLALLGGILSPRREAGLWKKMEREQGLTRVSSYFSHYLFEACLQAGKIDLFRARLAPWFQCLDEGFKTFPETFVNTRSDCHAWSAHPLYHYFTGVLGIRPGGFGFSTVAIRPLLEFLPEMSGTMAHPNGFIRLQFQRQRTGWDAEIELPEKLGGIFEAGSTSRKLKPGLQRFRIPALISSKARSPKAPA